jgi:hypothetical protein
MRSNSGSDRIFLAADNCVVQCLREVELKSPVTYVSPPPEERKIRRPVSPGRTEPSEESSDEPAEDEMPADEMPAEEEESPAEPADDDSEDPFK